MISLRPKSDTTPRASATGATRTLLRRGLGNWLHEQRVDAAMRIETGDTSQASVDDGADAGNRQRGLRDIGGDDYLAQGVRREGEVLLLIKTRTALFDTAIAAIKAAQTGR